MRGRWRLEQPVHHLLKGVWRAVIQESPPLDAVDRLSGCLNLPASI